MLNLDHTHAVVVLSGGQDSTTCLFWALQHYAKVSAVTFDYGQRHEIELEAAARVWELAQLFYPDKEYGQHEVIVVGPVLKSTSPLVSDNELEQYQDFNSLPGGLEKTFVSMRNQLFLTIAANRAYHWGAGALITGVCEEDFGGYPDCREVFIHALTHAIHESVDDRRLVIETPLMHLSKAATVRMAYDIPDTFVALAFSHTAYDGCYPPLGHDHATLLRAKGFAEANEPDPLIVRAALDGLMPMPDGILNPEDGSFTLVGGKLASRITEAAEHLARVGL